MYFCVFKHFLQYFFPFLSMFHSTFVPIKQGFVLISKIQDYYKLYYTDIYYLQEVLSTYLV